jgi:hypothetical protein
MATNSPKTIPADYARADLEQAYRQGWNHGHGIACHNVPTLGDKLFVDDMGRVTVDAENIREVHANLCVAAEGNSRSYSPFEFTAHEFNSAETDENGKWDADKEGLSEELWEAFDAGWNDALDADLAEYTDDDYGIEPDDEDE